MLRRFQLAVRDHLRHLPDYTCIETIARSRRAPSESAFRQMDVLRLQVGLIGGRERFTWPDAPGFDDREIRRLVDRGLIGTGDFAAHAQNVFLSPATAFTLRGTETLRGRAAARFEYDVPVEHSRYRLRAPPEEAEVAVRGSFWVDLGNLDLLRLEVHADDIPPRLGMNRITEIIDYDRVSMNGSDVLLAASSDLTMVSFDGEQFRNQIGFSECRQFRAESRILFSGADQAGAAEPPPVSPGPLPRAVLPASLLLDLALDSDIDPEKAAIGDPVRAVLARAIQDGAETVIPEGAVVLGRLVRLDRSEQPFPHYTIGLRFHTLETSTASFDFLATMQSAGPAPGLIRESKRLEPVFTRKRGPRMDILVREKPRGEGVLQLDVRHPQLQRGLKMRWLTLEATRTTAREP